MGECYQRHRHQEFLKFLRRLDQEFPGPVALHLVMDNYGTHNQPEVRAWLKKHSRFRFHFVPTSSSWLNLVGTLVRRVVQSMYSSGCVRQRGGSEGGYLGVSRHLE